MSQKRQEVINFLKNNADMLKSKSATIGLDAFVDCIVRVVKSKSEANDYTFFNDIGEFGEHLITKKGKSCGIEIFERFTKLGGNAPIMANALGELGIKVNCVGDMGYPRIDPLFEGLSSNCSLFTIGEPGYTMALEFNDGKIMLSKRAPLINMNWEGIVDLLGLDKLKDFFTNSNLIGLVNWNAIQNFNAIFRGIIKDIFPLHTPNKKQVIFFDLADCSERSKEHICEAIGLIREFNKHYKVILGLNENETLLVYKALCPDAEMEDLVTIGTKLYAKLDMDSLVIHTLKSSIAYDKNGISQVSSLFVKTPKLSTGGGDNFNGGLCLGQLFELDFEGSLYIANAVSGYYVRNGHSPSLDNLIETLEKWDELIED